MDTADNNTVGNVSLGLNLNTNGFAEQISEQANKAAKSMTSAMGKAADGVASDMASMQEQINSILNNTEFSTKSQVLRIAALYRKAGRDQSEAMRMAWGHVEHGTASTEELGNAAEKTGKKLSLFGSNAKKAGKETQKSSKLIEQMTSGLKKLAVAAVSAFAVKSVTSFAKECLELGSDLTEVQNVVDVTFPNMAEEISSFAKDAAKQFGLSETMAKRYAGTLGSMAEAFGFTEKQAASMATTLTGLAGDVASFYNINQDEAYTKLKSVFTGETESLKDLGIVMTQTALDSYALANGFGKTVSQMTEAKKVALRYAFVQDQLTNATGDFARTAGGSWANQVRIFSLQLDSLKATIGQGLINAFMPVIKVINTLMGKLATLAAAFKSFTEMIFGDASEGGASISPVTDSLSDAASEADSLADATVGVGDAAKQAAKDMQLMGFDEIDKLSDNSSDSSSDSSGSGTGVEDIDFGSLSTGTSVVEELDSQTGSLIDTFKELKGLFVSGFQIGFGNSLDTIEDIKGHLKSLKTSFTNLFHDGEVTGAFRGMLDSFVTSAGKISGSCASIGLTLADNLIGGFDLHLQQDRPNIKKRLVSIFNVSGDIAGLAGDFAVAAQDIFSVFRGENATQCTADIIGIFSAGFWGALDLGLRFVKDVANFVVQPITDNVDGIKLAIDNTLRPVSTMLETIRQGFEDTFNKACEIYDAHVAPMLQSFSEGISDLAGTILDSYNTYIAPVLQTLADQFGDVWENHVQPAINAFLDLIGSVADNVTQTWENTIQPFVNWIIETLGPVVAPVIEDLGSKALTAFGDMADSVKETFENLQEFFNNVAENLPTAGELIEKVTSIYNWFQENSTAIELVAIALAGFTAAIIANNIASNAMAISQGAASVAMGIYNTVATVGTAVTSAFGAAMAFLTSPITLVIAAITAVIAVGVLLYKNWDTISAKAKEVWASIKDNISTVIEGIKGTFNKFKTFISNFWASIKRKFTDIGSKIGESVSGAFKGVVNSIFESIENKVNGFISTINGAIGVINNIPGVNIGTLSEVSLPRLAQGGYVKANTPQLAVIGDNRTQGEIVAPEGKLREMAAQAASGGGNAEVIALLKLILAYLKSHDIFELDPESIRKYMIKKTNQNTKATGVCELVF